MFRFCWVLILSLLVSVAALPQGGTSSGARSIQGEVRLPNGRPVEMGAYVILESDGSGGFITTQTDSRGKFSFNGLAASRFRVRVKAPGYEEAREELDLSQTPFGMLRITLKAQPGTGTAAPVTDLVSAKQPEFPSDMPDDAKKEFQQGLDIFSSGKSQEKSVAHFKKSADKYDKYAPTYYYLGSAYAIQNKADDAIPALKKSIELNPKAPEALIALGALYNRQKNYPEAEKLLTRAVEVAPESFDAHEELAKAIMPTLQRTPEAQQHLEKAIALDPKSAEAHLLLGNMLLRKRDNEGALREYKESLKLAPNGPLAEPTKQMIAKLESTQSAKH